MAVAILIFVGVVALGTALSVSVALRLAELNKIDNISTFHVFVSLLLLSESLGDLANLGVLHGLGEHNLEDDEKVSEFV